MIEYPSTNDKPITHIVVVTSPIQIRRWATSEQRANELAAHYLNKGYTVHITGATVREQKEGAQIIMDTIAIKVQEIKDERLLAHLKEAGATVTEHPDNYLCELVTFPEGTETHTEPMQQHYTRYPAMFGIDPNDTDQEYDGTWQEDYYRINGFIFEHTYGTSYTNYEEEPFDTFRTCVIPIALPPTTLTDDHPF